MLKFKKITFLLIAVLSCTNAYSQKYFGDKNEIQKILKKSADFSQYYMDGEINKLANCYTEDGKIFPNKSDIIEGIPAIEKRWTLPEGVTTLLHKATPEEIRITGDYAYDYGYYEGKTKNPNGTFPFKGKYVIVWKKIGEEWKIYLDMWNSLN